MNAKISDPRYIAGLALGALGVVYGDICTSPLYALRECFQPAHGIEANRANVLGILSLIFWSLLIIVSIKYLIFVMRADNKGEGGILALLALAFPDRNPSSWRGRAFVALGIFGAALLYGDGIITPAISVLSAVEGLNVATDRLEHWVVPITVVILVGLFSIQRIGTGAVGKILGPVMLVWFAVIALLGVRGVLAAPEVLAAFNPWHAVDFLWTNGWIGFVVLGSVVLVVTGGEALYADMGHFGVKPIRVAWFYLVLPALMLNYLGQGALLLTNPAAAENPFYLLAPTWALLPLVALATAAAVIASQALISGAFSLTTHAIHLGYFPRLSVQHTSSDERGQIYIPQVNWFLMLACIGLVLGFRSSSNLAAAYGIAVTGTMLITTVLFYFAARRLWNWSKPMTFAICLIFFTLEAAFLSANVLKIAHGGWFPLVVGLVIFTLMSTWKTGRNILHRKLQASSLPLDLFIADVVSSPPLRVPGIAIFMSGNPQGTPIALLHNIKHNKVLHQCTVILSISADEASHVAPEERVTVEPLTAGFFRVVGRYGFMEEPRISEILEGCGARGLKCPPNSTTFFLSRETIIPTKAPGMALWRERLFALMSRNAQSATTFFRLPANRVVELGMQVEL